MTAGALDRLVPLTLAATALVAMFWLPGDVADPLRVPSELAICAGAWLTLALIGAAQALRSHALFGGTRSEPTRLLLWALAAWTLVACALAPRPDQAFAFAATGVPFLALAAALAGWLDARPDLRGRLLALLVAVVGVQLALALVQVLVPETPPGTLRAATGLQSLWQLLILAPEPPATYGTLGNRNTFAETMVLIGPVAAAWLWGRGGRAARIAALGLAAAAFMAVVYSSARTSLGGLAVGAAWFLPVVAAAGPRARKGAVIGAVAAAAIALALSGNILTKVMSETDLPISTTMRLSNWQAAFGTWSTHPIAGIGPGGLLRTQDLALEAAPLAPYLREALTGRAFDQLHHETFQVFLELGLVGGLLFLALVLAWFRAVRRRADLPPAERAALLAGMTAFLVASCMGTPLHAATTALLAVIVLAVGVGGVAREAPATAIAEPWRKVAAGATALAVALAGVVALKEGPARSYAAAELRYLADVARAAGGHADAAALYGAAARHERVGVSLMAEQVRSLGEAGRDDEALAAFAQSPEPLGAYAAFVTGVIHQRRGDRDAATAAYERVLRRFGSGHPLRAEAERRLATIRQTSATSP